MLDLATWELVNARSAAHEALDLVWQTGRMNRREAYLWLAGQLGIPLAECHISRFDPEECRRVVELATALLGERR